MAASDQLAYFSGLLGWGPRTVQQAREQIEQQFAVKMADWELLDLLPAESPPLLMLQAEQDAQTPLASAQRLAGRSAANHRRP